MKDTPWIVWAIVNTLAIVSMYLLVSRLSADQERMLAVLEKHASCISYCWPEGF